MSTTFKTCGAALVLLLSAFAFPSPACADEQQDSDAAAIRDLGTEYVAAFNKRDAKALAGFWSPDAVYTNRLTGDQVTGRDAIGKQFEQLFASSDEVKLEVSIDSIDFLTPNVAIEKGVATFVSDSPEEIPYAAVYIKRDGAWLLDRVTDDPQPKVTSHYEHLQPLAWMIGSWVDEGDGVSIQAECSWTKNQNFITRSFSASIPGQADLSGMQIIGWDAVDKQIRSWTFDSDGGFAEAKWTKNGNDWYVIKKGRTADGRTVSAVNVMTYVDDDTFQLKTVQRTVDGQLLPNIDQVTVVRQ